MSEPFYKLIKKGDVIFKEGDKADFAYIIDTGSVKILVKKNGKQVPVATLKVGDIFGEMGIIDGLPRSASAVASTDCHLSIISKDTLIQRVEAADPIARLLISVLLKRIRSTNLKIKGVTNKKVFSQARQLVSSDEAREHLRLESDLMKGLENDEFFLVYQPVINLRSRELVGFEALLRWNSRERGYVFPNDFIDVAEQSHLIVPLGEWVLKQGMKDLNVLQGEMQNKNLFMSINVSVRQLMESNFLTVIEKIRKSQKVETKNLRLEVTERVFQSGTDTLSMIKKVCAKGYSFSMDDFGSGYSSLTSLFNLQIETIKVDRTFVSTILRDNKSKAIVYAVVALAKELGINVVAEGIEDEREALLLGSMGCQMGQGYLFAKPLSISEIVETFAPRSKLKIAA